MIEVGKTECGKSVVSGVFFLQSSKGLPLDLIYDELKSRDMVISVPHYIKEAREGGWTNKTIKKHLSHLHSSDDFDKKLNQYMKED